MAAALPPTPTPHAPPAPAPAPAPASIPDDVDVEEALIRRAAKKVRRAKKKIRPNASARPDGWRKHGYGSAVGGTASRAFAASVWGPLAGRPIERVHADNLSVEDFVARYERPRVPVLISGLADGADSAPKPTRTRPFAQCVSQWHPDVLLRRFANHKFKVGTDDDGYPVRLKYKHFYAYARGQLGKTGESAAVDDSPLYIFDGTFACHRRGAITPDALGGCGIRGDYKVPRFFQEDLLRHAGSSRPPYRWFVLGPPRSGTGCHVDPLSTSAWNALVLGRKRWALLPPETPPHLVKPPGIEREAATWFRAVLPRLRLLHRRKHGEGNLQDLTVPDAASDPVATSLPPLTQMDLDSFTELHECIQHPGDVLYVPHGWHHAVLNGPDEFSVAITQNYVSSTNFREAFAHCTKKRPKMTKRWLHGLDAARPDLADVARGAAEDDDAFSTTSSSSSSDDSSDDEGEEEEEEDEDEVLK